MANGFWLRTNGSDVHVANLAEVNTQILQNAGSSVQENRRLTLLGYYFTLYSATSDMYVARVMVAPELIQTGDLTDSSPEDDDDMLWAKHYAHAGVPGYFQIKSKRTLGPDDKLWVQTFTISTAASIHWSFQSYMVAS